MFRAATSVRRPPAVTPYSEYTRSTLRALSASRTMIASESTAAETPRLLSLQSHAVHGYVGNKAATFPLQCLGFDVSAVNTTTLSNRPGYAGGFKGKAMNRGELQDLIAGLGDNSLLDFDVVVSGYLASLDMAQGLSTVFDAVRSSAPAVLVVCDPVLGDNGRFYVPIELLDEYKDRIIPRSDVVSPNAFETEALCGVAVRCTNSAREACRRFHAMGPEYCLLKGVQLHGPSGPLSMVLSRKSDRKIFCIDAPRIEGTFYGCGDLCTAVASAWLYKTKDLAIVLEHVSSTMQTVISKSLLKKSRELSIIECRDVYAQPPDPFSDAYPVHGCLSGIIFDMDGTLTEPGAIDFKAMYDRIGFVKRKGVDILTQISEDLHEDKHEAAHAIIVDEEMKGCDAMQLQPDLGDLLACLKERRIRSAISTRNCAKAYDRFQEMAGFEHESVFSPVLSRESLNGINKPDPQVANHILETWGAVDNPSEVWFVGDSLDDMICGKRAGCRTCLVSPTGLANKSVDYADFVDICVTSLSEFMDHIRYHEIKKPE